MTKDKITYQDSGVNIDAGNKLVELIKPEVKKTNRLGVMSNIGGFGGFFDLAKCNYKDPILVAATDGVGTKLKIAIETNNYDNIGQDLVAMCVNDLVVQGAEPLFFLDYYACGKLDNNIAAQIISSVARACKQSNCALIGGETAEMPGMYHNQDLDLAGFAVGAVERDKVLPYKEEINKNDIIIGISSSGIHANGFSLVRKIMEVRGLNYHDKVEFAPEYNYAELFLKPTELYVRLCLELHQKNLVKAFSHITGGGFTENIPRILPKDRGFLISENFKFNPLFSWLKQQANLSQAEMFKAFNCGYGMVAVIAEAELKQVCSIIEKHNYSYAKIGSII